jgi:hypothetical protein
MEDRFSGDVSLPEVDAPEKGEWGDWVRARWWASLPLLILLWAVLATVLFPILGLVTGSVTTGLLAGVLLGLAAAGAIGHRLGLVQPVDEARRDAPLWARLLVPLPVFAALWILFFVAVGALVQGFLPIAGLATLLAAAVTAAGVWFLGLYDGFVPWIRDSSPEARLGMLTLAGALVGVLVFVGVVTSFGQVPLALALLVPSGLTAGVLLAVVSGWSEDAYEAMVDQHFGVRLGAFFVLEILLTFYVALLVGGFVRDARFAYGIGAAAGLLVLVPLTIWTRTWRDAWAEFVDLGEEYRLFVLLPVFPLVALSMFTLIVVLTGSFEAAYILSLPAGLAALLAVGLPLGVTREIPAIVRRQNLPRRAGISSAAFAAVSAYAYFGIALLVQDVEIALIAGMALAGLVLGLVNWHFELDRGLGEEFEEYGALGEASVLVTVFVVSLALAFLALALTSGDFRLAFLVSVVVAAGLNYLIAHTTGLVDSVRTIVGEVPWWGDLLVLGAAFVGVTAYGTIAVGLFLDDAPIALAIGAVVGLGGIVFLSRDLALGYDVIEEAEEGTSARATVLVLAFLGGFLAGLFGSAAALSLTGTAIVGFPLFVALLTGASAVIALTRTRDWDEEVLGRVRSRTDKLKVAVILATWLAVGVFTGFFLTSLPVGASDLGIGSSPSTPLTLALGAGLLLWSWLPIVLFRTVRVSRGPATATLETRDRSRALASAGWGLLAFAIVLVTVLSVFNQTVLAAGAALAVGYLVALAISTRGAPDSPDDAGPGS